MSSKKSSWSIVIGFVLAAMVLGVCVACDDDDEESSWAPRVEKSEKRRGDDRSRDGHSEKCKGADYCDDKDFSPSFEDSPVYLCLPGSTCHFGEEEQTLPDAIKCFPFHCDPRPERA